MTENNTQNMAKQQVDPNRLCEVLICDQIECGKPATHAYPARGGGYMALCSEHAKKHTDAWPINEI